MARREPFPFSITTTCSVSERHRVSFLWFTLVMETGCLVFLGGIEKVYTRGAL
jgi:hypothetical protein